MATPLDYGNWLRRKNLLVLGLFTAGVGALVFILPDSPVRLAVMLVFAIGLISFLLPLYAYVTFSQRGGKFQETIYNLIIQRLGNRVNGRILDIGSGNGVLAVKLAQQHCDVEVVGIDYWGKDWEYSRRVCEQNACAAGVANRVHFQKGDAAALDFADDAFDGVISNLTFHEVRSAPDKRAVLRETLRVVKPGGAFAFVDYFYDTKYYGAVSGLEGYLRDLKLSQFERQPLPAIIAMPALLKHPKMLGKVGIIYGRK